MENIATLGQMRVLRFGPWQGTARLYQGITIRPDAPQPGEPFENTRNLFHDEGFSHVNRLKQVHGASVMQSGTHPSDRIPEGDGLIGKKAGIMGMISIADCVPVFIHDPDSSCWGLLHAGWRGVVAEIMPAGIRSMDNAFSVNVANLKVYLGPAICGKCYEIGPEVALQLKRISHKGIKENENGRQNADLRALLALQAVSNGLEKRNIFISRFCTRCHNDLFFSYRMEGRAALGQMWAFMGKL